MHSFVIKYKNILYGVLGICLFQGIISDYLGFRQVNYLCDILLVLLLVVMLCRKQVKLNKTTNNIEYARKFVKIQLSGIKLIKHLKPVLLIACIIFLSSIYNKIDVTMLNMMATDESVGYYSYAQKTVNMVLTMANAVTAALLPRLSYYYENDREGFYRLLDKGFQILCLMTLPLAVGMALVAEQTVQFLYGEAFAPAALTIQLMCPLILIKGFGDLFCYQLVYSTKSEKIILPAAASASIINVITNAALIPTLLQNGAVVASVISEFVTNAIQFIYIGSDGIDGTGCSKSLAWGHRSSCAKRTCCQFCTAENGRVHNG